MIACDRETLQILVTTGGNVCIACFYHIVFTKGDLFIYRNELDYQLLILKMQFFDDLTVCFAVVCNTRTWSKKNWKEQRSAWYVDVCVCVCACAASLPFTPQQTSPGPVAHLTSQV